MPMIPVKEANKGVAISEPEVKEHAVDLLIVGGGMGACGVAYEAVRWGDKHGLKIMLCDKAALERSGAVAQGLSAINTYLGENSADDYVRMVRTDLMGLVREDLIFDVGRHVDDSVHLFEDWGLPCWIKADDGHNLNGAAAKAAEQRAHETQARDARDEPLLLRRAHGLGLSRVVLVLGLLGPGVVVRRVVARRGAARVVAGVEVRVLVAVLGLGADDVVRHVLAVVDLCAAARAEARARLERRAALRTHAARCGGVLGIRLRGSVFSFRLFVFGEIGSVVHVICLPADWFFEVPIS